MKPSDRIHELAAKHAPPIDLPWGAVVYGTKELVKGLIEYLDEQYEAQQAETERKMGEDE